MEVLHVVCATSKMVQLTGVTETHNIFKTAEGAETRSDDGTVRETGC